MLTVDRWRLRRSHQDHHAGAQAPYCTPGIGALARALSGDRDRRTMSSWDYRCAPRGDCGTPRRRRPARQPSSRNPRSSGRIWTGCASVSGGGVIPAREDSVGSTPSCSGCGTDSLPQVDRRSHPRRTLVPAGGGYGPLPGRRTVSTVDSGSGKIPWPTWPARTRQTCIALPGRPSCRQSAVRSEIPPDRDAHTSVRARRGPCSSRGCPAGGHIRRRHISPGSSLIAALLNTSRGD